MILKSPPVHCQHIIGIFPKRSPYYLFCLSHQDTPIEILTFFKSPVGDSKNVLTEIVKLIWFKEYKNKVNSII